MVIQTIFDNESAFDYLCSIFKSELVDKLPTSKIVETEDDEDLAYMIISSKYLSSDTKTQVFHIKDKNEYLFRGNFYFYNNIKSDVGVKNAVALINLTLADLVESEEYATDRMQVSQLNFNTKFDFNYFDKPAYQLIVEFTTPPPSFHFTDSGYKLFDLWLEFNNFIDEFRTQLVVLNIDQPQESKVFINDDQIESLCR